MDVVKKPLFAIFTMLGGVLIALGAFLPWAARPLPYGQIDSFNGFYGNLASEGATFLAVGAGIAAIGAARRWANPPRWLQHAPLVVAALAGWMAGADITQIQRKILPEYPNSYVGVGWYVLYLGVGFAVLGALVVDRRPLPPLRPLGSHEALTPPAPAAPTAPSPAPTPAPVPSSSSVADVPGRPLSDWDEEMRQRDAIAFSDQPVDCARLGKILAVLGLFFTGICFLGQSFTGGLVLLAVIEATAGGLWLIGRWQIKRQNAIS